MCCIKLSQSINQPINGVYLRSPYHLNVRIRCPENLHLLYVTLSWSHCLLARCRTSFVMWSVGVICRIHLCSNTPGPLSTTPLDGHFSLTISLSEIVHFTKYSWRFAYFWSNTLSAGESAYIYIYNGWLKVNVRLIESRKRRSSLFEMPNLSNESDFESLFMHLQESIE